MHYLKSLECFVQLMKLSCRNLHQMAKNEGITSDMVSFTLLLVMRSHSLLRMVSLGTDPLQMHRIHTLEIWCFQILP
jgi:hypothetical protein